MSVLFLGGGGGWEGTALGLARRRQPAGVSWPLVPGGRPARSQAACCLSRWAERPATAVEAAGSCGRELERNSCHPHSSCQEDFREPTAPAPGINEHPDGLVSKGKELRSARGRVLCLSPLLTDFSRCSKTMGCVCAGVCVCPGLQGPKWRLGAGASVGLWSQGAEQLGLDSPDASPAHPTLFPSTAPPSVLFTPRSFQFAGLAGHVT